MRLSIIITAKSEALRTVLESAVSQPLNDLEILCAYSGPEDETWQFISGAAGRDSRVRALRFEPDVSLAAARKRAVSAAGGQYILFLDGRTVLCPDACTALLDQMDAKGVDLLHFASAVRSEGAVSKEAAEAEKAALAACGEEIPREKLLDACFVERRFGWSLYGKLYDGGLLRRVFAEISEGPDYPQEETLALFRILCHARGYAATETEGCVRTVSGAETSGNYTCLGDALKALDRDLQSRGLLPAAEEARKAVHAVCAEAAVDFWMKELSQSEAPKVFDQLAAHFSAEDLAMALRQKQDAWNVGYRPFVERLKGAQVFEKKPREIRTVAAYYHRAYNGGIEKAMTKLLGVWVNMGFRVVLITDEDPNELDYFYPQEVIRVSLCNGASEVTDYERLRNFLMAVRQYEIDAVVYNAWCSLTLPFDIIALKLTGTACIVHTHGRFSCNLTAGDAVFPALQAELGMIYQLADGVVALSAADVRWWSFWGLSAAKTYNPISIRFDPGRMPEKQNHDILWIGRLSGEKQPVEALKILAKLKRQVPDARLHIVGDCPDPYLREEIQREVEALDIGDQVTFHGYQTDTEPFYKLCSVHLLTSQFEGMPLVLIESKAMGLPCVCYDLPNVDMVRETKGMKVIPQGDSQAAADALAGLLLNEAYWKEMCADAKESGRVICEFDQAGRWREIFQQAVSGSKDAPDEDALVAVRVQAQDLVSGVKLREKNAKERLGWYIQEADNFKKRSEWYEWEAENLRARLAWFEKAVMNLPERAEQLAQGSHERQIRETVVAGFIVENGSIREISPIVARLTVRLEHVLYRTVFGRVLRAAGKGLKRIIRRT